MARITVLSAVPDAAFQRAIEGAFDAERDLRLVGETVDARRTLRAVAASHPDVLLLDGALARAHLGHGGATLLAGVHAASPRTRTILFCEDGCTDASAATIRAGMRGHMQTHSDPETTIRAIRAVKAGEAWLRRAELLAVLEQLLGKTPRAPAQHPAEPLTSRELEVSECLRLGLSNKDIARRLRIGDATVKSHVKHIFQKLGITRRAQLLVAEH